MGLRRHFLMGMVAITPVVLPAEPRRLRILFLELAMVSGGSASRRTGPCRLFKLAWFRAAVNLSLGALVLLEAGLYNPASSRYPSGGGIGAIIGPCWGLVLNAIAAPGAALRIVLMTTSNNA